MKINLHIILVLAVLALSAHGQATDTIDMNKMVVKKSIQLVTGFTFGRSKFVEIGIAKNNYKLLTHHPFSSNAGNKTRRDFGLTCNDLTTGFFNNGSGRDPGFQAMEHVACSLKVITTTTLKKLNQTCVSLIERINLKS